MEPPNDPAIGQTVDGYRIEAVLGRGGMGVVYKAEEVALSRSVAIKRIDPGRAGDETFLRRFRSEAQALARINSPYITRIHTLRKTELGPLIVMEHVEGGTLEDLLWDGPMEERVVRPILRQMLTAFEHAHGAGVIHRDVKPSNVLLTEERDVKVTDFGLAKVLQRDTTVTPMQGAAGTLNYMSPEQVQGQDALDHRTDLYSLGMTAYEMLAGRLPFDRDSSDFAKMQAIVEEPFAPPSRFRKEAPDDLAEMVMKALAKDPDERYRDAGAMREALDDDGEPPSASPEASQAAGSPLIPAGTFADAGSTGAADLSETDPSETDPSETDPSSRPSRKRRFWRGVLVGALVLVLLGGGYGLWAGGLFGVGLSNVTLPNVSLSDVSLSENGARAPGGGNPDHTRAAGAAASSDSAAHDSALATRQTRLTVETTPSGATVLLGEQQAGTTPLTGRPVESGSLAVRLKKAGYAPVDTLLRPEAGQSLALNLSLREATAQTGRGASASPPEERGAGPEGHAGDEEKAEPEAREPATLTVNVASAGSVEWNGERRAGGGTFRMPPGWQTVRLHHPEYETQRERVRLTPGQSEERVYHFKRVVRVKTNGPSARIWIDGRETTHTTPTALRMAPGRYDIRVSASGHPVSGGRITQYMMGRRRPVEFGAGNAKAISIEPGFREMAYEIIFRMRDGE
jgi:serine/threonine protein kinase